MPKKNFIKLTNLDVAYRFFKAKGKSNFLILHGWGASSDSWIQVGQQLNKLGFDVYIPDLPGFGNTELNKEYTLDDYA